MPSSKHQPSVLPLPLQPSGLPESPTHRERSKTRSWQSPEKHTDRSGTESLQTRRWRKMESNCRSLREGKGYGIIQTNIAISGR